MCGVRVAQGQVRGVAPSVTSLAPGRPFLPGPSVTSLGPHGWNHSPVLLGNRRFVGQGALNQGRFLHQRAFGRNGGVVPVFVPLYTPYGTTVYPMMYADPDPGPDPNANDSSSLYMPDPNYPEGYGLTPPSQLRNPPASPDLRQQQPPAETFASPPSQPSSPPEPQPTTMLVFKDGRKLEVTNYVIQGTTLFNLGGNGPRKIALADLDVHETVKANDERGVVFTLPQ